MLFTTFGGGISASKLLFFSYSPYKKNLTQTMYFSTSSIGLKESFSLHNENTDIEKHKSGFLFLFFLLFLLTGLIFHRTYILFLPYFLSYSSLSQKALFSHIRELRSFFSFLIWSIFLQYFSGQKFFINFFKKKSY